MDIPKDTKFTTKVVVVPSYLGGFTHSGYVRNFTEKRNYRWIKRGEPIGEFVIKGSSYDTFYSRTFNKKLHSVPIKSPVSGLVLHPTLSSGLEIFLRDKNWNSLKNPPTANFALLIPDDEPVPETGNYIYAEMCRLIQDMKHYYFRESRYWTMGALSEEKLNELIRFQLSANPLIFDALPNWAPYQKEARIKYPELRPYIDHL
ncbi:hypothetical protein LCGC14_2461540 [marine sediment metagenome]|uniref:Uncharacterized protein n=1 Tax=marine sediment metagenome TaxID=412755 RepID=A0A0F9DQ90_9ZZZZ